MRAESFRQRLGKGGGVSQRHFCDFFVEFFPPPAEYLEAAARRELAEISFPRQNSSLHQF
jgi:hypothetical protein